MSTENNNVEQIEPVMTVQPVEISTKPIGMDADASIDAHLNQQNVAPEQNSMLDFDFASTSPVEVKTDKNASFEKFVTAYSEDYTKTVSELGSTVELEKIEEFVKNVALATPEDQIGKISFHEAVANFNNDASKTKSPHDEAIAKLISAQASPEVAAEKTVSDNTGNSKPIAEASSLADVGSKLTENGQEAVAAGPATQHRGLAAGGGAALGGLATGVAKLASLAAGAVTAPVRGVQSMINESNIQSATDDMLKTMKKGDDSINKKMDYLGELAKDIKTMAPSDTRDARVEEFADKSVRLAKDMNSQSQKESRLNADPNNKSKFKLGEDELATKAESRGDRLNELMKDVGESVKGDTKNEAKIQSAQEKIAEMLKNMVKAIKEMFEGFFKSKKAGAEPT